MALLKYVLFFYSIIGILVSGGLVFNRKNKANIFMAGFVFILSIGQLNYLYVSTGMINVYPQFSLLTFSTWMLMGPFFWMYIKYFGQPFIFKRKMLLQLIPFLIFVGFTMFLFQMPGAERLKYVYQNFMNVMMPFNYFIALHISFYGVLMWHFAKNQVWDGDKKAYIIVLISIYIVSAVLQSYLTCFAETYQWFAYYFLGSSTLVLYVGYVMHFKPELIKEIKKKYKSSGLSKSDKESIAHKIDSFLSKPENVVKPNVNLQILSEAIQVKKHHISQSISEIYKTTLNELINRKRIEYAKSLLVDPNHDGLKIYAVALESGFNNKSTFNRAFVKYVGCAPSLYRKNRSQIIN